MTVLFANSEPLVSSAAFFNGGTGLTRMFHGIPRLARPSGLEIVFEYVELFYNPVRLHSSLGYLSPTEYERRHNPTLR